MDYVTGLEVMEKLIGKDNLDRATKIGEGNKIIVINSRCTHPKHPVYEVVGNGEGALMKVLNHCSYEANERADKDQKWIILQVNTITVTSENDPKPVTINAKSWGKKYPKEKTTWEGIGWNLVLIPIEGFEQITINRFPYRWGIKLGGNDKSNYKGNMGSGFDLDGDPTVTPDETITIANERMLEILTLEYSPSGNSENNKFRLNLAFDEFIWDDYERVNRVNNKVIGVFPNATKIFDAGRHYFPTLAKSVLYSSTKDNNFALIEDALPDPIEEESTNQGMTTSETEDSDKLVQEQNKDFWTKFRDKYAEHLELTDIDLFKLFREKLAEIYPNCVFIENKCRVATNEPEALVTFRSNPPEYRIDAESGSHESFCSSFMLDGTFTWFDTLTEGELFLLFYKLAHCNKLEGDNKEIRQAWIDADFPNDWEAKKQFINEQYTLFDLEPFKYVYQGSGQFEETGNGGYYDKMMGLIHEFCILEPEEDENGTREKPFLSLKLLGQYVAVQLLIAAYYDRQKGKLQRLLHDAYLKEKSYLKRERGQTKIAKHEIVLEDFQNFVNTLPIQKVPRNLAIYSKYKVMIDKLFHTPLREFVARKIPRRDPYWISFTNNVVMNIETKELITFDEADKRGINCRVAYEKTYRDPDPKKIGLTLHRFCEIWAKTVPEAYWPLLPLIVRVMVLGLVGYLNRIIYFYGKPKCGKSTIMEILTEALKCEGVVKFTGDELEKFEKDEKFLRHRLKNTIMALFLEADQLRPGVQAKTSMELTGKDWQEYIDFECDDKNVSRMILEIITGIAIASNDIVWKSRIDVKTMSRRTILVPHETPEGFVKDSTLIHTWREEGLLTDLIIDCAYTFSKDDIQLLMDHTDNDEQVEKAFCVEARKQTLQLLQSEMTDNLWDCFDECLEYVPYIPESGKPEIFMSYPCLCFIVDWYMLTEVGRDPKSYKSLTNTKLGEQIHEWAEQRKFKMRKAQIEKESSVGTRKEAQRIGRDEDDSYASSVMKGIYRIKPKGTMEARLMRNKTTTTKGHEAYHIDYKRGEFDHFNGNLSAYHLSAESLKS